MKTTLHKASSRGHANHGWLDTHHTFSFAQYYNPERMHFGVLRVLNDDVVTGGMGFGTHAHDNMEIISIPLSGDLEHKDSMGNTTVIKQNDVQIMSAGSGVKHSEYNKNKDKPVNFLQIWLFPKERNIQPRYDQKTFLPDNRVNKLQLIISPDKEADSIQINQDAWFYLGNLKKDFKTTYTFKNPKNGLYAFVINGDIKVGGELIGKRDGIGITDSGQVEIVANTDAEILIMEVPMLS